MGHPATSWISYDGGVPMPHALIVDDSAATLSALVELVSAEGFTTSAALTVDRAKVELSRQSPDIVLHAAAWTNVGDRSKPRLDHG